MKILHIYNDWKWTGPSEPILNLCLGLKQNSHTVHLACLPDRAVVRAGLLPPANRSGRNHRTLPAMAVKQGITPVILAKPIFQIISLWQNTRILSNFLRHNPVDIIHIHSAFDHHLAVRILKRLSYRPRIIRTNHDGYPLPRTFRNRSLLSECLDGYITLSENLRQYDIKTFDGALPADKSWAVNGAIDTSRFDRERSPTSFLKFKHGIGPDGIIVGVIARVQRHRRFSILLRALKLAIQEVPQLKLMVLGRGTYYKELLVEPVQKMGLADNVLLPGYQIDDYFDMISLMDFGVYLVPGSDGSCRAVLEMMASGKPVIVAKRGILPEIVDNEKVGEHPRTGNGLVIKDTPDNLAEAMVRLARDIGVRRQLGANGRAKVLKHFSIDQQVKKVESIYHQVTGLPTAP